MARQAQLHTPHSTSTSQGSSSKASYILGQATITRGLTPRHTARPGTCPLPRSSEEITPPRAWESAAPASSSSEDEWNSSSSSGGSDSDSEQQDQEGDYILPQDHQWQRLRPELLRLAHIRLKEFRSQVHYHTSSRTRLGVVKWKLEPLEAQDPNDPELVVLSPQRRKMRTQFHLACPFYASDPGKYKQCLLLCNQPSIEGIIDHLARHHRKPLYCARCSETFKTVISRDRHTLDGKCELLDPKPIDGINQSQRNRLWKKDRWHLDEKNRWRRMWTAVFPSQPPRSPYLDQGLGIEVSMARDSWVTHGWQCVSGVLSREGYLGECNREDDGAQNALCDLVLEDLLKDIIGGWTTADLCLMVDKGGDTPAVGDQGIQRRA